MATYQPDVELTKDLVIFAGNNLKKKEIEHKFTKRLLEMEREEALLRKDLLSGREYTFIRYTPAVLLVFSSVIGLVLSVLSLLSGQNILSPIFLAESIGSAIGVYFTATGKLDFFKIGSITALGVPKKK